MHFFITSAEIIIIGNTLMNLIAWVWSWLQDISHTPVSYRSRVFSRFTYCNNFLPLQYLYITPFCRLYLLTKNTGKPVFHKQGQHERGAENPYRPCPHEKGLARLNKGLRRKCEFGNS